MSALALWPRLRRARPRHLLTLLRETSRRTARRGRWLLGAMLARWAMRRLKRRYFPGSTFVGPYEREWNAAGMLQDQWLWQRRNLVRGVVLDMSSPRYYHAFLTELPAVERMLISDLQDQTVRSGKHSTPADVVGDFCATPPPLPAHSVDTVLCISILEHCADPGAMVRNLAGVLRPGGVAFFWAPYAYVDGHMGGTGPDYWRFGRDGYALLAAQAGLEVLETGQFIDLGRYFAIELGWSAAATAWHRGVPVVNWMICRRPFAQGEPRC